MTKHEPPSTKKESLWVRVLIHLKLVNDLLLEVLDFEGDPWPGREERIKELLKSIGQVPGYRANTIDRDGFRAFLKSRRPVWNKVDGKWLQTWGMDHAGPSWDGIGAPNFGASLVECSSWIDRRVEERFPGAVGKDLLHGRLSLIAAMLGADRETPLSHEGPGGESTLNPPLLPDLFTTFLEALEALEAGDAMWGKVPEILSRIQILAESKRAERDRDAECAGLRSLLQGIQDEESLTCLEFLQTKLNPKTWEVEHFVLPAEGLEALLVECRSAIERARALQGQTDPPTREEKRVRLNQLDGLAIELDGLLARIEAFMDTRTIPSPPEAEAAAMPKLEEDGPEPQDVEPAVETAQESIGTGCAEAPPPNTTALPTSEPGPEAKAPVSAKAPLSSAFPKAVEEANQDWSALQRDWLGRKQPLRSWIFARSVEERGEGERLFLDAQMCWFLAMVSDPEILFTDEEFPTAEQCIYRIGGLGEAQKEVMTIWIAAELIGPTPYNAMRAIRRLSPKTLNLEVGPSLASLCAEHILAPAAQGHPLTAVESPERLKARIEQALNYAESRIDPRSNNYMNRHIKSVWREIISQSGPLGDALYKARLGEFPREPITPAYVEQHVPDFAMVVSDYRNNMESRIETFSMHMEEARAARAALRDTRTNGKGVPASVWQSIREQVGAGPSGWWCERLCTGGRS